MCIYIYIEPHVEPNRYLLFSDALVGAIVYAETFVRAAHVVCLCLFVINSPSSLALGHRTDQRTDLRTHETDASDSVFNERRRGIASRPVDRLVARQPHPHTHTLRASVSLSPVQSRPDTSKGALGSCLQPLRRRPVAADRSDSRSLESEGGRVQQRPQSVVLPHLSALTDTRGSDAWPAPMDQQRGQAATSLAFSQCSALAWLWARSCSSSVWTCSL